MLAHSGIPALNRDPETSKQLGVVCLMLVQIFSEHGERSDAVEQARTCVMQSPGIDLGRMARTYAPVVKTLLEDARRTLADTAVPFSVEASRVAARCISRAIRSATT